MSTNENKQNVSDQEGSNETPNESFTYLELNQTSDKPSPKITETSNNASIPEPANTNKTTASEKESTELEAWTNLEESDNKNTHTQIESDSNKQADSHIEDVFSMSDDKDDSSDTQTSGWHDKTTDNNHSSDFSDIIPTAISLDRENTENNNQTTTKKFTEKHKASSTKNFKLGIVGGKGVGKTYLFHAMIHRLEKFTESGALRYFFKDAGNIEIYSTASQEEPATKRSYASFNEKYDTWEELPATKVHTQRWHNVSIPYRTGILGQSQSYMELEFFDGAGEMFSTQTDISYDYWKNNFSDISVIVFCLPLWVALPLKKNRDSKSRREIIESFDTVVQSFKKIREDNNNKKPVKTILALTMADDTTKTSLGDELVNTWLKPYMLETADHGIDTNFFNDFKTGGAVNRYLANARKTSNILKEKIANGDRLISNLTNKLKFGAGDPWIIPVSAIRGEFLAELNKLDEKPEDLSLPDHNPAHVELPLLVALCEKTNAIM